MSFIEIADADAEDGFALFNKIGAIAEGHAAEVVIDALTNCLASALYQHAAFHGVDPVDYAEAAADDVVNNVAIITARRGKPQ